MQRLKLWHATVFIMVFIQDALAQPCPVTWGPTQQISNTPFSAFVPRLAVVGDTVHVVYDARDVYYRRSTNGGTTWDAAVIIVPDDSVSGMGKRAIAASGNDLYFVWGNTNPSGAITSVKVRRSTDGGGTWLEPQVIIRNETASMFSGPIVATHGDHVYVRVGGYVSGWRQYFLIRSTDRGVTWDSVRQITFVPRFHNLGDIYATEASVHLVAQTNTPGFQITHMVSTDRGETWSDEQVLSDSDQIQRWEPNVAADEAGNVYVSWQDAKYGTVGGFDGALLLRRSSDNGVTWLPEERIGSLPSVERSALSAFGERVHAAWEDNRFGSLNPRVYYSRNQNTTWCQEFMLGDSTQGSLDATISALEFRVHTAFSMSSQVRHRRGDVLTRISDKFEPLPQHFSVTSFYPNPFNPTTRVQYSVPYQRKVTITVYDVLGRRVKELFDGTQQAGTFTIEFDATSLTSGVYFIRFQFGTQVITKGVVLMR